MSVVLYRYDVGTMSVLHLIPFSIRATFQLSVSVGLVIKTVQILGEILLSESLGITWFAGRLADQPKKSLFKRLSERSRSLLLLDSER